jgi:hypothetical protein
MFNPFSGVNWYPNPAEIRVFGRSLIAGFPFLSVVLLVANRFWRGTWSVEPSLWLGGIGLAAGVLFVLFPFLAKPFYILWYFLAYCIGMIVGNTLLAGFYLLIITPVGVAMRAFGRQSVCKTFDRNMQSYWTDVETSDDVRDSYRQF